MEDVRLAGQGNYLALVLKGVQTDRASQFFFFKVGGGP
jgi:hypothetical protein